MPCFFGASFKPFSLPLCLLVLYLDHRSSDVRALISKTELQTASAIALDDY